jgi:hypothetical protein
MEGLFWVIVGALVGATVGQLGVIGVLHLIDWRRARAVGKRGLPYCTRCGLSHNCSCDQETR